MNPGGRLWRVDLAAVVVAAAIVGLFTLAMGVEQILPRIGAEAASGPTPGSGASPDCHQGRVALTFDGGPDREVTNELLDLLHAKRIVATFFLDGRRVADELDVARRIAADGHQIGLYAPPVGAGPAEGPTAEPPLPFGQVVSLFVAGGLRPPRLVRPEGGAVSDALRWSTAAAGLEVAADPGALDIGDRDLAVPQTLQQRILDGLATSRVLIAHDTSVAGLNTIAALGPTIDEAHARGYCFAHLDDVHEGRGAVVLSDPEQGTP